MFGQLSDRLSAALKGLRGKGRLTEADVDSAVRDIRVALLDADVALPVVREFCARVKEQALSTEVSGSLNPAQHVVKIVHDELVRTLGGQARRLRFAKQPPTVILLAGLQGAGKTSLAGKLAKHLADQGHTPLLVAADLQRPNAVDQLRIVGESAGVPVFAPQPGNGVGDPVTVARESIDVARRQVHDIVIVDTAGRLAIDADLMAQLQRVRDAVQPDEVLLVIDAMTGQDAVATASAFHESIGIDGIVLTKLDGDARGGAALSVVGVTGQPILFAGVGERVTDFEVFHPDRLAGRILDMGDVLTLIEQSERAFDADQQARLAAKVATGEQFTLEDFLEQMQSVKKMGPISKVFGMLPGMGQMKEQLDGFDDRELVRIEAIIQSMTPGERRDPKVLDARRRVRIANGSGTSVPEVNALVKKFAAAATLMKQMTGGKAGKGMRMPGVPGIPQIPGMPAGLPAMPGAGATHGGKSKAAKPGKGARKSGNPAKRAAAERGEVVSTSESDGSGAGKDTGLPDFSKFRT
ncbi:MAG: signal recognition particle protein [Actinobacteria bacterium]|nr:signal recognition particle protein [Actinomycetota bacterium]